MNPYNIISKTIGQLVQKPNTSLEELAEFANLSPSYLQKTFVDWCGVSPKQFSRYLTLNYAKGLLAENKKSNLSLALDAGLSSTGRLHDLFVDIEAMTPGEYKNGGQGLTIYYSLKESIFGSYIVANTTKGVCNNLFCENLGLGLVDLQSRWPKAKLVQKDYDFQMQVKDFFDTLLSSRIMVTKNNILKPKNKIKLHLHGTNFQLKVWEALLSIPEGKITNYGSVASQIGDPKLSRAVGAAIGDNPVGFLIPCRRVLQSTGAISGYRWGVERKRDMLGWEAVEKNKID